MTTDTPAPVKRSLPRRIAVISAKVLGVLLLLVVLAVAGVFIWLRTDSATNMISDIAVKALADQGLGLHMDSLSGPLPQELSIKGLTLRDDKGVLVTVKEVAYKLHLSALFSGKVQVDKVLLDSPEIFRLPVMPPKPEQPEEEKPSEPGSVPVLPVDIILGELAVKDGRLHTNALHPPASVQKLAAAPAAPEAAEAQPASPAGDIIPPDKGPVVNFGATVSAELKGTALNAAIQAMLKDAAGKGIDADIGLEAAVHSLLGQGGQHDGDKLKLSIKGDETPGGPLSQIAGQDIPGYAFSLTGNGPVSEWHGVLNATLDPIAQGTKGLTPQGKAAHHHPASLIEHTTDFVLQCATGSFWKDLVVEPDFTVSLNGRTSPGAAAPGGWRPVMGTGIKTDVNATAKGHTYTAKLAVNGPAFSLAVDDVEAAPHGTAIAGMPQWKTAKGNTPQDGTQVKATIKAAVTNLAALAAMGGGEAKPLPVDSVTFGSQLFALAGKELTGLESNGNLGLAAQNDNYKADHHVSLSLEDGAINLKRFLLEGLGITTDAKATVSADMQDVKAQINLEAKDHAPWQHLVAQLAALPPTAHGEPPLGGALHLQANIALKGNAPAKKAASEAPAGDTSGDAPGDASGAAQGDASGDASDKASGKSGSAPSGSGGEAGTGAEQENAAEAKKVSALPYSFFVTAAHAAVASPDTAGRGPRAETPPVKVTTHDIPQGDAQAEPKPLAKKAPPAFPMRAEGEIVLTGKNMRWPTEQLAEMVGPDIKAVAHLSGGNHDPYVFLLNSLDAGIFSARGKAALSQAKVLEASFLASVSDLVPLAGKQSGVSGAVDLALNAKGPLDNLDVGVDVDSKAISLPQGQLKDIALKTRSNIQNKPAGLTAGGTVDARIGTSPGGPVSFDTGWDAFVPANQGASGPLTAKVKDLVLTGAGLDLRGGLNVLMRTDTPGAKPVVNGGLSFAAKDWKKIAALSGAPLSGAPATVDIRLTNQGKQGASVKLSAPSLTMQDPKADKPTLMLQGVTLDLAANDLFDKAAVNMDLKTGRGLAGPLRWRTGDGFVKGDATKGNFAVALHRRPGASTSSQNSAGKNQVGNDQLRLKGNYDLAKGEVNLADFVFADPSTQTGLRTQKPFVIKLDKGVTAKGLDVAFWPSGKLTADAVVGQDGGMNVKADLNALPFSFLRMFTPATLPGGTLSAKTDFTAAPGKQPKLALDVQSRISATKPTDTGTSVKPAMAKEKDGVLAFTLKGEFTQSPGAPAASGSGVRSMSGITWFKGTGAFGNSSKADGAKEGKIGIQVPMRVGANGMPAPDAAAPMAVGLKWDGPIESLWQAVPMPDRYLSGPARFTVQVAGNMTQPKPSLSAYLAGVRFESIPDGLLINGIDLEVESKDANNVHAAMSAKDNESGKLALVADVKGLQSPAPSIALRGQLDGFQPLHRDDISIALSGIFGVNGPLSTAAVTGDIVVDHGEVILSDKLGGGITQLDGVITRRSGKSRDGAKAGKTVQTAASSAKKAQNATVAAKKTTTKTEKKPAAASAKSNGKKGAQSEKARIVADAKSGKNAKDTPKGQAAKSAKAGKSAKKGKPRQDADADNPEEAPVVVGPDLNLHIRIPQHMFIRGMGLDSEWAGDLKITGVASAPSLVGSLKPVRGYLDIMSRYFTFDKGDISFYGGTQINPALNLTLVNEGSDITAYIKAGGTAKKPTISFESNPPLPRDEILSHVLFGKKSSDLSRLEAIQLANSIAQLSSGNVAPDVLSGVRKKMGLDMLRLGGSHTEQERSTSGESGEQNLTGKKDDDHSESDLPTLEAGKYVTDHIYIGVEQGLSTDSTAVRVDVELTPEMHLEGKSSAKSSEVGLGWKMDY
ncbi:translocation/assembly module TamB domain-containing protein [Desulfovibrio sp. OttesenSCG-928-G15]|nr:translocation/assembly module TamB domain-containing protein [Desulfovibrio sp. OttesenSCG-928-G15]